MGCCDGQRIEFQTNAYTDDMQINYNDIIGGIAVVAILGIAFYAWCRHKGHHKEEYNPYWVKFRV